MHAIDVQQTVGEIATGNPGFSRVFEGVGIDFCCGGTKTVEEACRQKGLDPQAVLNRLQEEDRAAAQSKPPSDVTAMSLTELVNHIEKTHHAYLREELPRLAGLTQEVAFLHGGRDPRLHQVQETFRAMALELWCHMFKEEQCLFPMIRQLDINDRPPTLHCGTLANPIRQMESEHDDAGSALERLRELTDGFAPPEWASSTYRALLDALAYLETNMHLHIHKENVVLFPSALEMDALRWPGPPVA